MQLNYFPINIDFEKWFQSIWQSFKMVENSFY